MKIAAIHATHSAIHPLQKELKRIDSSIEVVNFLDENLLYEVNKNGQVTKRDLRRFLQLVLRAQDSQVDGIIIGCSVYCPYLKVIEPFIDVPISTIDLPMIQQSITIGQKIGIVATTASAAPTAAGQIEDWAQSQKHPVSIESKIVTEAMDALKLGDSETHDQLIRQAVKELAETGTEVAVLAQITMARALPALSDVGIPVLTSLESGARNIVELIRKSQNGPVEQFQ